MDRSVATRSTAMMTMRMTQPGKDPMNTPWCCAEALMSSWIVLAEAVQMVETEVLKETREALAKVAH